MDLGPLDEREVREALVTFDRRNTEGVVFDADAIDLFVAEVAGYPYAFQMLGKAAWDAGDGPVITADEVATAAAAIAVPMRERYAARVAGLTDDQLAYLIAAARLPPAERTPTRVCRAWLRDDAVPAARCGGMTQRLINEHQILRRGSNGVLEFALPGMGRYLAQLG